MVAVEKWEAVAHAAFMIILCDTDICCDSRNLFVYGLCIATYSFYCFWIAGFVTFSSPFLMQDFEEQPTHGTHPFHAVPDSKSQDPVSFLGPFSIRYSLLLL